VLNYHGVADVHPDRPRSGSFVRPVDLRRQIEKLRAWGHELVTFGELGERLAAGDATSCAALTFDDAIADDGEGLLSTLRETGATGTVFAVSGWLGKPCPWVPWARIMTVDELRDVARAGIEIGAHTVTHPDLTALSYEEARSELEQSKRALEAILGAPVTVAAYPYGYARAETRRACRDAGFRFACRAQGWGSWDDLFDLPRIGVGNGSTLLSLRLKRNPRYRGVFDLRPVRAAQRVRHEWLRLTR
jgi:peptidoglycan/xylan/chitin deacetylase (PgdA/CDA1 family)